MIIHAIGGYFDERRLRFNQAQGWQTAEDKKEFGNESI